MSGVDVGPFLGQQVEGFGLDGAGAIQPPLGLGEVVGEHSFFRGGGLVRCDDLGAERVKLFLRFASNEERGRVETVSETVLAGGGLAFGRTGSG